MNCQHYLFVHRTRSRRRYVCSTDKYQIEKTCTCVKFMPTILQPSLQWPARSMEHSHCEPNLYTERLISSGKCKATQNVTVATGTYQCSVVLSLRPIRQHCTFYNYVTNNTTVPLYSCTIIFVGSQQTGSQASIPMPWNVSLRGSSHILNYKTHFSIKKY